MTPVIAELSALMDLAQSLLWAAAVVFVRTGAVVALMPGLGDRAVPPRIKLALVLALTIAVTPLMETPIAKRADPAMAVLAGEALAGLILGIGMRLYLLALMTAASIVAQATTLSQLFAGAAPEPQPAIGNMLVIAAVALALAAGLHVAVARVIVQSCDVLPPGGYPNPGRIADWGLGLISSTFELAFALAAPFAIGATIYNLALGAINRAMPQLMVSMIGAPALTLGSLALMAVAVPLLLSVWLDAFSAHIADPFGQPR